ncbi:7388_t:CDS:2 [Ambispora leptoticha]|uniref:7388_t:CDS:1 n=1 Tax=Ambispora leptoticha TaxID=144679 RepID=A0A9N9AMM5_9GLOM|nr:7388_t:CDS:2 [Ambispora leptoticha]
MSQEQTAPQSPSSNKPRRRSSFIKQWDKTTTVVNVKQKFYTVSTDRYTPAQKATFTKWVNIQLRTIPLDDENASKIPEITAIDQDFRDGKRLIQLLHALHPNDQDLPKPERGKTRHHYVANVTKVLKFLETKLDDSGLAALKAIGPVDIVDGNVKLTLGLLWLMIAKHQQLSQIFEVEEERAGEEEELFGENEYLLKESENTYWPEGSVSSPTLVTSPIWDKFSDPQPSSPKSPYVTHNDLYDRIVLFENQVTQTQEQLQEQQEQLRKQEMMRKHPLYSEKSKDKLNRLLEESDQMFEELIEREETNWQEIQGQSKNEAAQLKRTNIESLPPLKIPAHNTQQSSTSSSSITLEEHQDTKAIEHPSSNISEQNDEFRSQSSSRDSSLTGVTSISSKEISELIGESSKSTTKVIRADKRMSAPLGSLPSRKSVRPQSTRFQTLHKHQRSNSTPPTSNSWLIFWLNMQLVDYGSQLPATVYPIEEFNSMNNGLLLASLIHSHNKDWLPEYSELIKEGTTGDAEDIREKAKIGLSKCFAILEEKMNIPIPKMLVELLIASENSIEGNEEKINAAWSTYVSEIFLTMTGKIKREKPQLSSVHESGESLSEELSQTISPDDKFLEQKTKEIATQTSIRILPPKRRPVIREPSMAPQISIVSALWEWTLSWMLSDNENTDIYDDYYDKSEHRLNNYHEKSSFSGTNDSSSTTNIQTNNHNQMLNEDSRSANKRIDEGSYVSLQLLTSVEQPSLSTYWD